MTQKRGRGIVNLLLSSAGLIAVGSGHFEFQLGAFGAIACVGLFIWGIIQIATGGPSAGDFDSWPKILKAVGLGATAVQAELDKGASPNVAVGGITPLILSVSVGKADVLKLLVDLKVSIPAVTPGGDRLIHVAAAGKNVLSTEDDFLRVVEILLAHGFTAADKNANGKTPAEVAEAAGNLKIAEFLKSSAVLPESATSPMALEV